MRNEEQRKIGGDKIAAMVLVICVGHFFFSFLFLHFFFLSHQTEREIMSDDIV